jgi:adenylate kinase
MLGGKGVDARILLVGAPGSGKGTQAEILCRRLGLVHVSTGDMLRAAAREQTLIGATVRGTIADGALVSDRIVFDLVCRRLEPMDRAGVGFVLDGYPRTVTQLVDLQHLLRRDGIDRAIELTVPRAVLVERLTERGRDDDGDDTVRHRLLSHDEETAPMIRALRAQGKLAVVDGTGDVCTVHEAIVGELARAGLASSHEHLQGAAAL